MKELLIVVYILTFGYCAFGEISTKAINRISHDAVKEAPTEDSFLTNFHVVVPGQVFRGGRLKTEKQFAYMESKYKIKTIINLQGADPEAFVLFEPGEKKSVRNLQRLWAEATGYENWINIPLDSWDRVSKAESQDINRILEIINDPNNQPVFVHCEHGKDRTGLVIALFQVLYQKPPLSPGDAIHNMYEFGHSPFLKEMDNYFNLITTPLL